MAEINNASFSFRLSEQLKKSSFQVIEDYGLTPSQVFNMFLTEISRTKSIPVSLDYLRPNAETLEALREMESGEAQSYLLAEDAPDNETAQ